MKSIGVHIKKAFLEVLPAFIFFLIMFYVLVVTRALVMRQYDTLGSSSIIALIGALIVAKVILITGRLPFLNVYPRRPLIWNVVLKTAVFGIFTFLFILLEEIIHNARRFGGFSASWEHMKSQVIWPAFWVRLIWLAILLLFYCAAVEFYRVVGFGRTREIFFGK
jgi:hypothetical protein